MSWSSILLIVGGIWLINRLSGSRARRADGRRRGFGIVPIIAVIALVSIFSHRSGHWPWDDVARHRVVSVHRDSDDARGFDVRSAHGENIDFQFGDEHVEFPRWIAVLLGSIVIISGAMWATRGRAGPVAVKALTLLGLAAGCYALVSFFSEEPPRIGRGDHIVKVEIPEFEVPRIRIPRIDVRVDEPSVTVNPKKAKRAKRPSGLAQRNKTNEEVLDQLPPRAGEIPVSEELAAGSKKAEQPAPAADEPATVVVPEPVAAPVDPPAAPPLDPPAPVAATESESAPAAEPQPAVVEEPKKPEEPVVEKAPLAPPVPVPLPVATPVATAAKADAPPAIKPISKGDRPAWIDSTGRLVGNVYRISVKSGPYVDVPESQHALDEAIKKESDHYIDEYVAAGAADLIQIPLSYLRQHVVKEEFGEVLNFDSVGPMQQIHALLEFDDATRADFKRRWRDVIVTQRLWYTGSGAALVLALLGTIYGYLTLDLRTGGAHKGQLRLAATLVALIVAAGALIVRRAVPF